MKILKKAQNQWIKQAMKMWLDDIREMPSDFDIWVKTVEEAKSILETESIDFISFDNDLGLEKEGRHLADWIEEKAFNHELGRLKWQIHSGNPVGAKAIHQAMQNAEKFWNAEMMALKQVENQDELV